MKHAAMKPNEKNGGETGIKLPHICQGLAKSNRPKRSLKTKGKSETCLTAPSKELRSLARDVRRISPERTDPEKFLIAKEQVANRLIALSRRLEVAS